MIKSKKKTTKGNLEIYTHDLSKIYGKGQKAVNAVNKINLGVEPGVHGFLGPNGAGKTSTINMLIGAISITSGEAEIRGSSVGSVKTRKLIGFLPQDPVFYDNMTGTEYLIYMAHLNGLRKFQVRQKIEELLEFFDLTEAKDRKIEKYSGGMKQKVGIAAALVHDPEILILDEPTANLDPMGRADLVDKIKKLSGKMSVFVSSHILSEIEQMCDKVTMINKGKIILSDTIKNIKEIHKESTNIFVLDTNSNDRVLQLLKKLDYISKAWISEDDNKIHIISSDNEKLQVDIPKLIVKNDLALKSFFLQESSLQDIFVEIIGGDEQE